MSINRAAEIRIRLADRPEPLATVTKLSNPGICGDPEFVELTLFAVEPGTTTAVLDSAAGIFTDISLGFETCHYRHLCLASQYF